MIPISNPAFLALSVLLGLLTTAARAVTPVKVQGSDFVNNATSDRFQILGVAYQPGGSSGYDPSAGVDPLSDGPTCLRDAALMQRLGLNTIRVYNVDPSLDHDDCATIFNEVGIYMLIDVNSPLSGESIDRSNPSGSYTVSYLQRIFSVVEAFHNYPNTLAFFAGNEVINDDTTSGTVPPYMRAVTRDLKNYIAKNSPRQIPVGYSAADVRDILFDTWEYLQCSIEGDTDNMSRVDLFGLNSYSWCGDATFTSSGYDTLVAGFANTTVPVFFSEYGCNQVTPRIFTEVQALYGVNMTGVFSGGLVYEYSQEVSNYGLVVLNSNGSAQLRTDYDNLQSQYAKLNITALESQNSTATSLTPPVCNASLITSSSFSNNFTIPDIPSGGQDLINSGISNANVGKIVTVTNTTVTQTVQDSSGTIITPLAITPLADDESNTPNSANSASKTSSKASSTSASATPSATKKSDAGVVAVRLTELTVAVVVGVVCAL